MKFSVLISIYKNEIPSFLDEALNSILNQTTKPSEIVLVKDGSLTKELDDIITKYNINNINLFKIIQLKENVGLGKALNIGIQNCKYDIVARMDSDDISTCDRFEKQLKILKENKKIDIVGSYIGEFSISKEKIDKIRKVPIEDIEIKKYSKRRNPLNHVSVMYKKQAVLDAGNYQHSLYTEDYDLWVRMFINGCEAINIPQVLVKVRCNDHMYQRRGGLKYIKSEYHLQNRFLKLKHITLYEFVTNIALRVGVRIIPNKLRKIVYTKLLRSNQ